MPQQSPLVFRGYGRLLEAPRQLRCKGWAMTKVRKFLTAMTCTLTRSDDVGYRLPISASST
eukprot:scaffold67603_cov16-Prasinocladus_malaysianus.AAC.2